MQWGWRNIGGKLIVAIGITGVSRGLPRMLCGGVRTAEARVGGSRLAAPLAALGGRARRPSPHSPLPAFAGLRLLRFAFQGALQCLIQGGLGGFVFLLADAALLVLDFELEEFFFQASSSMDWMKSAAGRLRARIAATRLARARFALPDIILAYLACRIARAETSAAA